RRAHLAQVDGAAVAELARPVPELVAAIVERVGLHGGQRARAAKDLTEAGAVHFGLGNAQFLRHFAGPGDQAGLRKGARLYEGVTGSRDLTRAVVAQRIGGQGIEEGPVEGQGVEPGRGDVTVDSHTGMYAGKAREYSRVGSRKTGRGRSQLGAGGAEASKTESASSPPVLLF